MNWFAAAFYTVVTVAALGWASVTLRRDRRRPERGDRWSA